MKKIVTILIAIALIAMIGTAAANPSFMKITPEDIVIVPDGSTTTSVKVLVYDYNWGAGTPQDRYISGYSDSSSVQMRLSADGGTTWTAWTIGAGSANRVGTTYSVTQADDEHLTMLEVIGSTTAILGLSDNRGTTYIDLSGDNQVTYDISAETPDVLIPEFPTVALPVAAILGLAFIFQRRREED